jgi:predicted GIY-YIG superfamily endonuclease
MQLPMADQAHKLYRFFDADGVLLYVGITMNPGARWDCHSKGSRWWSRMATMTAVEYPDRYSALAAEREAVKTEHPLFNVAMRGPRAPRRRRPSGTRRNRQVAKQPAAGPAIPSTAEVAALGGILPQDSYTLHHDQTHGWTVHLYVGPGRFSGNSGYHYYRPFTRVPVSDRRASELQDQGTASEAWTSDANPVTG